MSEYKISKDVILEAGRLCPTVRDYLQKEVPEAFEDDKYFNLSFLNIGGGIFKRDLLEKCGLDSYTIQIRDSGEYKNKAFYLDNDYNWEVKKDNENILCLILTRKKL